MLLNEGMMKMQLEKLFTMQKMLDHYIEEKHQLLKEDLFDRKALALLVEIGELANETRCFKFWSLKPSSEKQVILEEFVDGIHFILSLGLECGFEQELNLEQRESMLTVSEQFLIIYEKVSEFRKTKSFADYREIFELYLQLAEKLGISEDEIEQAYIEKNEVNYKRQENNY